MLVNSVLKIWALSILVSTVSMANTISTPGKVVIAGNSDGLVTRRVCYYQDKAYSDGAILQVGDHYLICSKTGQHESNGALKWYTLGEQPEPTASNPVYKVK